MKTRHPFTASEDVDTRSKRFTNPLEYSGGLDIGYRSRTYTICLLLICIMGVLSCSNNNNNEKILYGHIVVIRDNREDILESDNQGDKLRCSITYVISNPNHTTTELPFNRMYDSDSVPHFNIQNKLNGINVVPRASCSNAYKELKKGDSLVVSLLLSPSLLKTIGIKKLDDLDAFYNENITIVYVPDKFNKSSNQCDSVIQIRNLFLKTFHTFKIPIKGNANNNSDKEDYIEYDYTF